MAEVEATASRAPPASGAARLRSAWPFAGLARFAARFGGYLLLSSGLFWFAYKFYQPAYGGTDYFKYYPTYLHPLDLRVAPAPFVYRQLSAVVTNLVYRFGPYYDPQIFFSRPGYDQHVFFAAMLTNYLALAACAAVTAVAAERLRPGAPTVPLLAGAFCYLAFFAQASGMGPITDGMAWLLVAIGFFGYVSRSLAVVGVVLALSIVERETIPVMIGAIAGAHVVMSREQRRFDVIVVALSIAALAVYLGMRMIWAPVAGHAEQTHIGGLVRALSDWRSQVNTDVLLQGYASQNLLILLGLTLAWRWLRRGRTPPLPAAIRRLIVGLFAAAAALAVVSFLTMIGQNVGRIIAMLTPVAATLLALSLLPDERATTEAAAAAP